MAARARASLPLGNFDQNLPGLFGDVGFHDNLTVGSIVLLTYSQS